MSIYPSPKYLSATSVKLEPRIGTAPIEHIFDEDSVNAVNTALAAARPLLVRGEPGVGKSQLARAAAAQLGRAFVSQVVDARTEARDLCYRLDTVARLGKAQLLGAARIDMSKLQAALEPRHFVEPSVLWWAFDWESALTQVANASALALTPPNKPSDAWQSRDGAVVLIDELDKADSSVPNGLLEALGDGRFPVPVGCGHQGLVEVGSRTPPLVVVTTNEERSLPDAFLRRCVVLPLALSTDDPQDWLVRRGRAHFPADGVSFMEDDVLQEAARLLLQERAKLARHELSRPGLAEYLDLLRAVSELAQDKAAAMDKLKKLKKFTFEKHPRESGGAAP